MGVAGRPCAITLMDEIEERALIFYVAMAFFLANFALGILVQLRVVDTKPFRWLRHALFFAAFASAAVAAGVGFLQGPLSERRKNRPNHDLRHPFYLCEAMV